MWERTHDVASFAIVSRRKQERVVVCVVVIAGVMTIPLWNERPPSSVHTDTGHEDRQGDREAGDS